MTYLALRRDLDINAEREAEVIDLAAARRQRELSNEPWVKKEKVAEHFDVSTRTVYRWVVDGCPKKRLPGGTLRFQIGQMRSWLDSG